MDYLASVKKQFLYYKTLGEKAMDQLDENQLFFQSKDDSNSISIIVKHLVGNMLSRWTDVWTTDGEKDWRNRDQEFVNDLTTKEQVLALWSSGWECLFLALESFTEQDLDKTIYIRHEGHTILEAINRQLAHYPYHVGQIVYLAKELKTSPWQSLSIPKNQSIPYNDIKFSQERGVRNFIDDELEKLKNTKSIIPRT